MQVGIQSIQSRFAPNNLDDFRLHLKSQLVRGFLHAERRVSFHLHLDQFARLEGVVERLQQRVGEAVMPDMHRRSQVMRLGAEFGSFFSFQWRELEAGAGCWIRIIA